MASAGGRRRLVYLSDPPLAPNGGEPQPRGQQDSVGGLTSAKNSGLWLLFLVVTYVIACFFYPICKKAEEQATTSHGHGSGGEDRRRARWQRRQQRQRQAAAAVPEVVVDIDKSGQLQVEPALECTYQAAEGWEERTCSVCLAEVQDGEAVRMLMPCMHYFHAACVDRWMRKRATCPICRAPTVAAKAGRRPPAVLVIN